MCKDLRLCEAIAKIHQKISSEIKQVEEFTNLGRYLESIINVEGSKKQIIK